MNQLPPLALYIHIPWCEKKCPYCDFNSHENFDPDIEPLYVQSLLNDLDQQLDWSGGRQISSVFFGGGTPSLFSPTAIDNILSGVRKRLSLTADCEITLESNPGSGEAQKYRAYRASGVNRLSIGVQSFANSKLAALGRIHSAEEAKAAIDMALNEGFKRLNVDLMYGLPAQEEADAITDIETALSLGIEHLSWYQLTIERNTAFWSRPPDLPSDEITESLQTRAAELLTAHSIFQYEVSAWSKGGEACRHNLNYWQFGDYLAIGAGAHGKLTFGEDVYRFNRTRQPKHYLAEFKNRQLTNFSDALKKVEPKDLIGEFMMNALRLRGGIATSLLKERTHRNVDDIAAPLADLRAKGLIEEGDCSQIVTTPLGYRFLDSVVEQFL